jgi:hypothetical protein
MLAPAALTPSASCDRWGTPGGRRFAAVCLAIAGVPTFLCIWLLFMQGMLD